MLGIDVSKDNLVASLMEPITKKARWTRPVPNTEAGIRKLLALTPADVPWVLEPTGRYSLLAVKLAQEAGRTVLMADPKAAHHFLKSLQSRAKTDKIDSKGLALMGLERSLKPYRIKAAALEQVDQLLSARRGITDAITRLKLQARELPHAAGPLRKAVEELETQQRELEHQLARLKKEEPTLAVAAELERLPGIGLITAVTAVSRLASHSFARADQWVAFVGWDIDIRQSGKRKGEKGLTKQGEGELRRLFYLAAKSSVRAKGSPFAAQYEREKKKGLKKTAALCAVARKMARVVWSLYHHQTTYDPGRVYAAQPA